MQYRLLPPLNKCLICQKFKLQRCLLFCLINFDLISYILYIQYTCVNGILNKNISYELSLQIILHLKCVPHFLLLVRSDTSNDPFLGLSIY